MDDFLAENGPEATLNLIAKAIPAPEKGPTQAQLMVELAEEAKLFHAPDGDAYASVQVGKYTETWALRSKGFRKWLGYKFYLTFGKTPGIQATQEAIGVLEGKAQYDSPQELVFTRVAAFNARIYHDLANEVREVVEISADGWRVVQNPPVHFRRPKGMLGLPHPDAAGSVTLLRDLINVGDDKNWALALTWLVAALRGEGPYPVLILQGEQGAAKSTTARFLRRVIDPSKALVRTPPRNDHDLLIAANNSLVISYDNLSSIPQRLSDALCRLATGGGFSIRELYTDQEEIIFEAMRPVMLNGIDHLPERADLADRAIILNLPRVENRVEERVLNRQFETALPGIMAGLYTALGMTLRRLPEIKLVQPPRMADFAAFGVAAEPGLGLKDGAFLNAYLDNRSNAVDSTLANDVVAAALRTWAEKLVTPAEWEGECQELLYELQRKVDEKVLKSKEWPGSPKGLSNKLRRLVPFLREVGIDVCFPESGKKGTNGKRNLTIRRIDRQNTAPTSPTATTATQDRQTEVDGEVTESGGCVRQVAVAPPASAAPPLSAGVPNLLEALAEVEDSGEGGSGGGSAQPNSGSISEREAFRI